MGSIIYPVPGRTCGNKSIMTQKAGEQNRETGFDSIFLLSLGEHFLQCRSAVDKFFQLLYV